MLRLGYQKSYSKTQKLLVFMLISILSAPLLLNAAFASEPLISINPESSNVTIAQVFKINVSISDALNVYGWELKLFYKNAILNCTGASEGSFLSNFGGTAFVKQINNAYNSTHGRVLLGCSLEGNVSASGNGDLAIVTFKAKKSGNTALSLVDTVLLDPTFPNGIPIPHTTIDGRVHVAGGNTHDIAVVGIITSKTGCAPKATVAAGYSVRINVTVENQGDYNETFNVTAYANATQIGTKTVSNLISGDQAVVTIKWNTVGFAYGNYLISAQASTVSNESDTSNNVLVDGVLLVTIPGDVDGNFAVTILDVVKISSCYASKRGKTQFISNSDLDDNDVITILDVVICTSHYAQRYP